MAESHDGAAETGAAMTSDEEQAEALKRFVTESVRDLSGDGADDAFHRLIEAGPRVLPQIISTIQSTRHPSVRPWLVRVLLEYRSPDTAPFLAELVKDNDPAVWKGALDALVAIGGPSAREALARARETSNAARLPWIVEAIEQVDEGM